MTTTGISYPYYIGYIDGDLSTARAWSSIRSARGWAKKARSKGAIRVDVVRSATEQYAVLEWSKKVTPETVAKRFTPPAPPKVADHAVYDGQMLDVTTPHHAVEVVVSDSPTGRVVHVNIGPVAVLRICRAGVVTVANHRRR